MNTEYIYTDEGEVFDKSLSTRLLRVFRSSVYPEKGVYTEHHHTAFEITMVLSGSGTYATKSAEAKFKKGDIFFFSTDEFHWLTVLDEKTEFLNIHFEPRFIWSDNFGISNAQLTKIFLSHTEGMINILRSGDDITRTIETYLYKTEQEFMNKKPEYQTMAKLYIVSILIEIIRYFQDDFSNIDVSTSSQTIRYVENAMNYIDSNLETDLTLDKLSDIAHMSKTYFSCQFKKLNGISPWEYITIKRIEKAIEYIETTHLTKLEIAVKCGYNNTSNFYHSFKKVTGKTPKDYINRIRNV